MVNGFLERRILIMVRGGVFVLMWGRGYYKRLVLLSGFQMVLRMLVFLRYLR